MQVKGHWTYFFFLSDASKKKGVDGWMEGTAYSVWIDFDPAPQIVARLQSFSFPPRQRSKPNLN